MTQGAATVTLFDAAGRRHVLNLGEPGQAAYRRSPQSLVPLALAAAAIAHGHLTGVVTGPDSLELIYPTEWPVLEVFEILDAALEAGFGPGRVTARAAA
ncbi:hypothetical protein [Rhodococcus spongiicola]|nr:hypothetical protein [Rhodococcus spongiicola]